MHLTFPRLASRTFVVWQRYDLLEWFVVAVG